MNPARKRSTKATAGVAALTMGAIGVVFGDIGTSPLYAIQTVFSADHQAVKPTEGDVFGVISLVFWSITMIVSVKFVTFIMRADNDGEGGIVALIALIQGARLKDSKVQVALIAAGFFGVALFYGDGMITPAISVMSAVEGVEVAAPGLTDFVLPMTIGVLTLLFFGQKFGTHVIGRLFGPVMVLWFIVIAAGGIGQIVVEPAILKALSPAYGLDFFTAHPSIAFISLGAIVLTITGAEALYADMGHFGRPPIRRAWFLLVFPALTLNYLGQGSLILDTPSSISNPFFLLFPDWSHIPMVILATVATVIASQAVISGAFSVTRQAIQLGYLPRMTVKQTSSEEIGQVYLPAVNWGLFVAVVALVIGFDSSAALASAYGVAVVGTLTIDALLFLVVARSLWKKPLWMVVAGGAVFLTIDLTFLAANLTKIAHGGWFPLGIGLIIFTALVTWHKGHEAVAKIRAKKEGLLLDFVAKVHGKEPPVLRVPGTAVYLNVHPETTPLALKDNLSRDHVIHERIVVVSLVTTKVPFIDDAERVTNDDLGDPDDGLNHLTIRLGFLDVPDVPALLRLANGAPGTVPADGPIDVDDAYYYVSNLMVSTGGEVEMAEWRKRLFTVMYRNATSASVHFHLPPERTVIESSGIAI
ncbi:MAG: KUP/HAK/KT family potassium transporter [Thermoleophilia bacterium]|nr:KUP/HAK/KT family potassium transporter [Thermoleophilia bacterium]